MANAPGKRKSRRNKLVNLLLLYIAMLPVGFLIFWASDELRFGTDSAFAVLVGVPFLVYVCRQYPSKFRDPTFVGFLIAWVLVRVAIFLLVLRHLGFLYYIPIVILELWVGYTLAIQQFGPPTQSK